MSEFAVTIEHLGKVWPHQNADRLDLASLIRFPDYQFVVPRGQYHPGDTVVYFPIDSLMPEPLLQQLGLAGKLSGRDKNRVKTIRLRGEISQGLVALPSEVGLVSNNGHEADDWFAGDDVTEALGVTHYEPPIVPCHDVHLHTLPPLVEVYDIQNAERYPQIVEMLMDVPVLITEKLDGSHYSATLYPDGRLAVCTRRHEVVPIEGKEHDWHKVTRMQSVKMWLRAYQQAVLRRLDVNGLQVVTLRGELVGPGVQRNIYKLTQHEVRFFGLEVDGIPYHDWNIFLDDTKKIVPVLAWGATLREWLQGRTLRAASTGPSRYNADQLREGIVIAPLTPMFAEGFGRVILKQRSPEYLAESES